MVSYQLGLRALQEILHRPDIQSFHQVRFWDDDDLEAKPILAYLCLGRSGFQLVQTSHIARQLEADMRPLGDDLFGGADVEDAGEGDKYGAAGSEDMMPDPFVYEDVEEVVVHAQMEDHFGIILTDDRPKLHLSSVYRKDVVSDLTIYFNTHMIHKMNTLLTLRVSFTGMSTSDPSKAYRHPAIRMFKDVPKHMLGRHVFYRRGYMFLGPSDAVDRYELMDNRPTSTYVYRTLDSTPSPGRDVSNSKHLLVRFLPPKAMGVYDNLSLKRFELWTQSIAHATALREYEVTQKRRSPTFVPQSADIASLRSAQLEASGVDPSEASLQETTGKGAAFVPQYVDSYMVVRQGTYRKKLNVVGDQSAWLCYRVHIYTATREIGVFGVRRMFLPPMLDTYQDMVFILFGRRFDGKLTPDPGFMPHLESVIDSISPVSAALQTRIKQRTGKSLSQGGLDPTYYDRVVLQARANALFYNKQMFGWLRNQPGLNVSPNTKFIDKGCDELARIFCNSIVRLMDEDLLRELADENRDMMNPVIVDELEQQRKQMESVTGRAELPEKQLPVYVDNPLSIIFRMQSGGAQSSSSDDGGVSEDSLGDWRRRIANYFAYCVDGGQLPSFLTINRLAESVKVEDHMMEASARDMISNPHTHTIDRVLEFLLYLVPADAAGLYEPADNIIKKVQLCQDPETSELVPGFICNEWVMVRLLQTQYIEQLVAREVAEGAKQAIMGAKKILTYLLKGLLQLTHNLELIEAVTVKVETATIDNASELIDPYMHMLATGNDMLKTLAIRGLTAINLRQSEERVVTHPAKPVELCMAIIRDSKSADLLLAAVHFIKTAYRIISMIQPNPLIADKRSGSSQADDKSMRFIDILLTMLDRAFNTQVRHHPRILGDIAMILLYISRAYPRERAYLIEHKVIERLMAIIEHYDTYSFILPEVTGALTLILTLNKNQDPRHRRRAAFDMAEKHAKTLVPCLRQVSTSTQMKVTNNILATLDIFLDPGDGSGADGMAILYSLTNDSPEFDFNRILAVVERKGAELERSGEDRVRKTAKITNRLVDKFRRMIHQGTMSGWEGRSAVRDAPGLDGDDDL